MRVAETVWLFLSQTGVKTNSYETGVNGSMQLKISREKCEERRAGTLSVPGVIWMWGWQVQCEGLKPKSRVALKWHSQSTVSLHPQKVAR